MYLNIHMIKDYLNLPVAACHISSDFIARPLKGIAFYRPGTAICSEMVTLISYNDLEYCSALSKPVCLLCPGTTIPASLPDCADVLMIKAPDQLTIYEDVQRIFQMFSELDQALHALLKSDAPLNHFGNAALKFLYNPISLYSEDMRLIFFSERTKPKEFRIFSDMELNTYLPDDEIEDLKVDEVYNDTIDTFVPSLFPADRWGYRILYYNIRIDNIYVARLMVLETDRPLRPSDHTLLMYLAEFIAYMMQKKNITMNNHPRYLDECLFSLLKGEVPDPHHLHSALRDIHWKLTDSYICFTVIAALDEKNNWATSPVAMRIEKCLPSSIALLQGGRIIVLSNLAQSPLSQEEQIQQLIYVIREGMMKAGISRTFDNLSHAKDYYQQSITALSIGEKRDPTFWFYRYERYALLDLLSNAHADRHLESWYPVGLKKLMEYDKLHNRQLVQALRVYLRENMHIANTIRVLYLQRATFLYQLRRIEEISELKLDDPDVRLELLIVFSIMDKIEENNSEKACPDAAPKTETANLRDIL